MGMVPSIIDVWGYDREFCSSSSSSSSITQKPKEMKGTKVQTLGELVPLIDGLGY
jgi:hypothetical protein